ncbi:MAG: 2-oxoacid:ferredoxin oxidoreductase subunit gamma [Thermotogae bacterium]|uniref:2-oxoacid:ferredoxin oxidoreductase subunit gamma n=1 Tax=Kosmotoga arenicorallina TaxID=688066 RepID=A0A7C5I185_9BACT|nr:2-oxoacid:acceptor oxidoreductase family protein [Kosmotoga sp.]RKX33796.1 MAG: 2-oxoacid:ferredoxin oxidoreductase subunit gamma [Thermotogota bacterium]HHF08810.1 2-oxoacid:ferredoxin oxidoreductase subunit gamma [Kosmotoga arenicorallina]MBO8166242.1 2-oxoacid:acceptor oxidoreductase family protein [Kosmotoga sp.]MCD6159464.1 2-oxoacid:acceptor oxidoreductase family protein [Kosmotoga sp.]RKX50667.1 MAG: 2-oxoacid:ferredoxin oxidoreductase subunit gamma [Thermotogota bacterium]
MSENILIAAGFGGQGVMLLGQILATAAMYDNKHSTWLPSYGPEMRGGTANCTVVISDELIGSPVTDSPGELIIMNIPSLLKFEPALKEDGLLILNTSVVDRAPQRKDVEVVKIDANKIAEEIGNTKISNMVMLGAYLEKTGAVTVESVEKALRKKLTGKKAALIELNLKAIEAGMKLARK